MPETLTWMDVAVVAGAFILYGAVIYLIYHLGRMAGYRKALPKKAGLEEGEDGRVYIVFTLKDGTKHRCEYAEKNNYYPTITWVQKKDPLEEHQGWFIQPKQDGSTKLKH